MKRGGVFYKTIALVLVFGFLFAPAVALAGGGNKYFKRGNKYEAAEQWDLAAEQYALALNQDPSNPEYKLHLVRSLTKASLMFMERGKILAEQKDYDGAYQAFRQAYSYDNTNELALTRMKEMLEKQNIPLDQSDLPQSEIKKASERADQTKKTALHARAFRLHDYSFREASPNFIIRSIAESDPTLRLNVIYENVIARQLEASTNKINYEIKGVSAPRALEIFLNANKLGFAQIDRRTIMVFQDAPQNKQRYEDLMVRTFYIKNGDINDLRNLIQTAVGSKQIIPLKQLNAIVVRDTPENLKMIESLLETVDKPQSEVVLDVNLYEVSNDAMLQIGNQLLTATDSSAKVPGSSLTNLGGIGQQGLRAGSAGGVFGGPFGIALAAPSSVLTLLQSKSLSKLVATSQIRAFENQDASVNIGSRVPVQTATIPTGTVVANNPTTTTTGQTGQPQQPTNNTIVNQATFGVAQFQYVDVGLNIDFIKPQVFDEYVQMQMSIESTGLAAGPDAFHPSFTQRRMKGVARIKEGETGVVANVMRLDKSDTRSGFPVLSFIPIVGRLFSTPTEEHKATNVVITVTPHVLRSPEFTDKDRLALGPNGTANAFGATVSLEEMIIKADEEEGLPTASTSQPGQPQAPNNITTTSQRPGVTPTAGAAASASRPSPNQTVQPAKGQTAVTNVNQTALITPPATSAPPEPPPQASSTPSQQQASTDRQPAVAQTTSPVIVTVRVLNPQIKVGQGGLIGVILSSSGASLSGATMSMRFNPNVIKITSVRDGGLLSLMGAQAEFTHTEAGDTISININRPAGAQPVQASGQLVLIYFQGIGEGMGDLNVSEIELHGPNGQPIPVSIINGNIEVQGNGQQQPPGNGQSDDED